MPQASESCNVIGTWKANGISYTTDNPATIWLWLSRGNVH
jgi:hypothetical protein